MRRARINFHDIKLGAELGAGQFGVVHAGTLRGTAVAVTRLPPHRT